MQLWRYGQAIERLGERYRLVRPLGSGGMADVCLAWDEQLQSEVAIKVIKSDELEQRTLNRFLKEAAQVAKWRHPHILRFYGEARLELLDPARGSVVPYIVMEYAQGGDLHHRLRKGQPYPLASTLILFSQLCSAVGYAHAHGLIHRDLKPQNILFRRLPDGSEQALLSDFGLAVEVSATHHSFARGGTLPYMAPEQLRGQPIPASDIFALGVILYQLCTGRLPFQRTLQDMRRAEPLPRPILPTRLNPALPAALDAIILRALADEPGQRYADADEFWLALKNIAPTSRTTQPSTPHPDRSSTSFPPSHSHSQSTRILVPLPISDPDLSTRIPPVSSNTGPISSVDVSRLPSNTGPVRSTKSRQHPTARRGPRRPPARKARLLIPALIVLVLAVSVVVNVRFNILPNPLTIVSSDPTIVITPMTRNVDQSYTFTLVHNPTNNPNELMSRTVKASMSNAQTVDSTGTTQTPGTLAKGQLEFLNGAFNAQLVPSGAVIIGSDGVQVITDEDANIPAANTNNNVAGHVVVAAHSANVGTKGNILALDINQTCCVSSKSIFVKNLSAFTGGQDAQSYHYPTENDIDQAISKSDETGLDQKTRQQLQGQLVPGEQPVTGTISCNIKETPDHPAGAHGIDIPRVTVTNVSTCQEEAYAEGPLQKQITPHYQDQVGRELGQGYQLVGMVQVKGVDASGSFVPFSPQFDVLASGRWKYNFGATQVHEMLLSIVSKNRAQASLLLKQSRGVAGVSIQGGGDLLPAQIEHIHLTVTDG